MLFRLNPQLCYELAGVADAASTDKSRPALCQVNVSVGAKDDKFVLRAVATDSYMLAKREITIDPAIREHSVIAENADAKLEPINIDAKAWKKVMKEAAQDKTTLRDSILVEVSADGLTVATEFGKGPEVHLAADTTFTYPDYQKLIGERISSGELTLPAFNATLLRRMESAISAKPADRNTFPIRLAATVAAGTRSSGTELRPWSFWSFHDEPWYHSEIEVIIMPMRTADAA